ncbi:mucin-binding protein [Lactobacillaceae bacterium Melli_B4]
MLKKVNEKKVLHKVKKQWVVLGTALLAFATTGAYSEVVHADAGDNHSSTVVTAKSATDSSAANTETAASDNASSGSSTATSQAQTAQSTGSSAVSSASQPATTTSQTESSGQSNSASASTDDDISFRDGDATSSVSVSFASSMPSYSNVTPIQVNFMNSNGSSSISSSAWIAGDNVARGDTFSIDIPQNINEYAFTGGYGLSGSEAVSNVGTKDDPKYVLTGKFDSYKDTNSVAVTLHYGIPASASVVYKYSDASHTYTDKQTLTSAYAGDSISTQNYIDSLTAKGYKLSKSTPSLSSNTITLSSGSNNYELDFDHNIANYDQNSSSYPDGLNKDDFTKTFNRTINLVNAANNNPISNAVTQTVTYNRSATYDEVTKSASYGDWSTDNSSFAEYTAPSISGYVVQTPSSVAAQNVNVNDSTTTNASIEYKVPEFNGSVKYIDTDANNQEIDPGETFSGNSGAPVQYSTKHVVDSLTAKGYKLVSGTPSDSLTINDSNNDYTFTFTHNTSNYDANSSSYPTSLTKDDFTKTFTRTINFVNADTKQPVRDSTAQTVTYNRSAVYDEVTKSASYGDWTTNDGSFAEYAAPSVDGYNNPQPASVAAQSVSSDTQQSSFSASIEYTKSSAAEFNGTVKFLDADDNNSEVAHGSFSGPAGALVNYSSTVDSLTSKGYKLTSDSPSVSFAVKSSDNDYVFKLAHNKSNYDANSSSYPASLNKDDFTKTFTRTINFVNADNKQPVRDSATQTVTYNRSAVYDEVTKSASYGAWTTNDSSFAEYAAPSVDGYNNPQPASVAAQAVSSDTQQSSFNASIEYTKSSAAEYSGSVKFLDIDENNQELANASYSGTNGAEVKYSTQSVVDSLTAQGYKLVSGTPSDSLTINDSNNDYTFTLAHNTSNYDAHSSSYPASLSKDGFTKTFTRTINFVNADTKQSVRDSAAQTVTYNRSAVYDEVTKSASYGNWTTNDSSFAEYAAPSVDGYNNPQPASVAAQSVSSDTQQSSFSTSIEYTKSSAAEYSGSVKFLDIDENNKELAHASYSGTSGAEAKYSTRSVVDSLTAQGYRLVSGTPSDSITINDSNNDYTFTLAHNTSNYDANSTSYPASLNNDDFTKTFTRTINFVNADNKQPVRDSAAQTVTYNRSAVYDEVTKSASYGAWTTNDSSFAEYAAPSVDGYNNPQPASVAAQSVSSDTQQSSFSASIEYTKSSAAPSSSTTTITYVAPSSSVSYAPFIFYSAPSSVASSSASASSVASSTASSVADNSIKMYNNKTELVKRDGQILIFIQPKYAPNDANGSLSDQYVVNQQLDNGQISHSQQITLDQYNSMLTASGKQPYTPETLNEAYIQRHEYNNIMKNRIYKTTFDAVVIKQGNNVLIDTDTHNNGFSKPDDNKLVVVTASNRVDNNASHKHNATKKKSHKKANHTHKHAKKAEHHVTKHTHHIKHDRKQKK